VQEWGCLRPTASSPPLPNDADAHAPKATWLRPRSTTGNAFTCHTFTKYAILQVPHWLQFTTHCSLQHSTMYTTGNPERLPRGRALNHFFMADCGPVHFRTPAATVGTQLLLTRTGVQHELPAISARKEPHSCRCTSLRGGNTKRLRTRETARATITIQRTRVYQRAARTHRYANTTTPKQPAFTIHAPRP
jgi:hypothetical protein